MASKHLSEDSKSSLFVILVVSTLHPTQTEIVFRALCTAQLLKLRAATDAFMNFMVDIYTSFAQCLTHCFSIIVGLMNNEYNYVPYRA